MLHLKVEAANFITKSLTSTKNSAEHDCFMAKIIKLYSVFYLIYNITFLQAIITEEKTYKALVTFDEDFWGTNIENHYNNQRKIELSIAHNVAQYLDLSVNLNQQNCQIRNA